MIGWKVGRVPPPLIERFGTDRLAGPIFAQAPARTNGAAVEMPVFAEGFAAGEAEFLLRIGAHAARRARRDYSLDEAADLIDAVHVGIEIASSPLGTINELGPIAVISDFGNNNGLVDRPGDPRLARERLRATGRSSTTIDGVEAGSGRAAAFPDGAIGAARFLFELMARRGIALAPGQWISSGAVTGVHRGAARPDGRGALRRRPRRRLPAGGGAPGIGIAARERSSMSEARRMSTDRSAPRRGSAHYRWVIVGLLFAATVINYIDRQMIGVLKPTLSGRTRLERDRFTPTSSSGSSPPTRSAISASAGSST